MGRFKIHEERLRKIQSKKAIKKLKTKGIKVMPRTMKEINDDYSLTCARLGDLTHKLEVQKTQELELREKLKSLSSEASERNRLDNESAAQPTTQPDVGVTDVKV
jgi:hypothetical protein